VLPHTTPWACAAPSATRSVGAHMGFQFGAYKSARAAACTENGHRGCAGARPADMTFTAVGRVCLCMLEAYDATIAKLADTDLFKPETINFNNGNMLFYNTFMSILKTISSESEEGDR
jgi:hypothetical protein